LSSCEEENYKLEKTINILKEQLEDYENLKVELDHRKGELYIMLFQVVGGTSRGSSWLRINEFLNMTK
jgi:hypothetical protein